MKPSIFKFTSYRSYLRAWVDSAEPGKKRGQLARISEAGNIHKTTLSQIFSGSKDLTLEQAERLSAYLGLGSRETEFLLLLVNAERSGTTRLRKVFESQIEAHQRNFRQLSNRVTRDRELTSEERAIYYSNWFYAAVRNLTALEGYREPSAIALKLRLEPVVVEGVLEFLLRTGLCVRDKNGLKPGPSMTHLEALSPLVARHHGNWRVKAMERHPSLDSELELAYTAPMTLSAKDAQRVQALIADLVAATDDIVGPSPSEKLYCMCIDWFEVR